MSVIQFSDMVIIPNEKKHGYAEAKTRVASLLGEDDFEIDSLAHKWDVNLVPNASVTVVGGVLECSNLTGDAHSGWQVTYAETFATTGKYEITFDWFAGINDHYNAGEGPGFAICNPDATRISYYGTRQESFIKLLLAQQGAFTTQRTEIRLTSAEESAGDSFGSLIGSQAISIDESVWHAVKIEIDFDNKEISIDLDDGAYTIFALFSSRIIEALGTNFVVEFQCTEYNKNNTEKFDNFVIWRL